MTDLVDWDNVCQYCYHNDIEEFFSCDWYGDIWFEDDPKEGYCQSEMEGDCKMYKREEG